MSRTKVNIALAGVSNHGNTILEAILANENLHLVSCFDTNTSAMESTAGRIGIKAASGYSELVADPDIEAVALATPNHVHLDQVREAASRKKHVFLEKPIANSMADAREIVRSINEAGLILSIGHNSRRKRTFRTAKKLLEEGKIGVVVGVDANLSRPAGLQEGLPEWKADARTCPLLPMMQLGIHFIDTISYLVGTVSRVACLASRLAMKGSALDTTAAVMQLESGVTATLSSHYITPETYSVKIYGTKGIIRCTPTALQLERTDDYRKSEFTDYDFSDEGMESYILEMKEFGDCIIGGTKPEIDGETGLRALACIEAMLRSYETGRVVEVEEIINGR